MEQGSRRRQERCISASQLFGQSLLAHCSHVNPAAVSHDVFQFINFKIALIFFLIKKPLVAPSVFHGAYSEVPEPYQLAFASGSAVCPFTQLSKHAEGRGLCSCWLGRAVWNPVYWLEMPTSAVGVGLSHSGIVSIFSTMVVKIQRQIS